MKRRMGIPVLLAALVSLAFAASGDVVEDVGALLDSTCISNAALLPIVQEIVPCCVSSLVVAGDCVTKGDLSVWLYECLDLTPTFLERLFGVSLGEKVAIAQRNGVMVLGSAEDAITGLELTGILVGAIQYILGHTPHACDLSAAGIQVLDSMKIALAQLLPPNVLCEMIPAFCPPVAGSL